MFNQDKIKSYSPNYFILRIYFSYILEKFVNLFGLRKIFIL